MNSRLRRSVLENAGWSAVVLLIVGLLIGVPGFRLSTRRFRVSSLELELAGKLEALHDHTPTQDEVARWDATEAMLLECDALMANEALRIEELSRVAREAGVSLLSLRSLEPRTAEDGATVACPHELRARGTYRQLARFLAGLQSARGLVSIGELEIEHDADDPAHLLNASLEVSWHAPNPHPEKSEEGS